MRRHQRCIGNRISVLSSTAIKWSFHVLMARSTALTRLMCEGTNWYHMYYFWLYLLKISEASLYIPCTRGLWPLFVRCLTCLVYTSIMWLMELLLRGYDKIALASYKYIISTYLCPRLDIIGDFTIWSVYILWASSTVSTTSSVFPLFCSWIGYVFVLWSPIFLLVVVNRVLFLISVMWPLIVA